MRNFLFAFVLAMVTVLGGCATPGTAPVIGSGPVTAPDIQAIIAQVQSYCRIACGFVPTASTIANIISGGNPAVMVATSISEAICNSISPSMKAAAGRHMLVKKTIKGFTVTPGAVNGVPIVGDNV